MKHKAGVTEQYTHNNAGKYRILADTCHCGECGAKLKTRGRYIVDHCYWSSHGGVSFFYYCAPEDGDCARIQRERAAKNGARTVVV